MKTLKYYIIALVAILCSCELETLPESSITFEQINTPERLEELGNDLYAKIRYIYSDNLLIYSEIQADCLNSSKSNYDQNEEIHRNVYSSNSFELESIYDNLYGIVSNANFILAASENIKTEEPNAKVENLKGLALFSKALAYYSICNLYCVAYNELTAGLELGAQISNKYNPNVIENKPKRSNLKETYKIILDHLNKAEKLIVTQGEANSDLITKDAVIALRARVSLSKKDYKNAIKESSKLIASNAYQLETGNDFKNMFINDNGGELIFLLSQTKLSKSANTGYQFNGDVIVSNNEVGDKIFTYSPNYLPTQYIIDLYDDNDIRKFTYFKEKTISIYGEKKQAILVNKYPGNPEISLKSNEYHNHVKLFRISEMYLIRAESYYNLQQYGLASKDINLLKSKRISGYANVSFSKTELDNEIKNERLRELCFEGHRIADLKRWNINVNRSNKAAQYSDQECLVREGGDYTGLNKSITDKEFNWPIPESEMLGNENMKGQQSKGW